MTISPQGQLLSDDPFYTVVGNKIQGSYIPATSGGSTSGSVMAVTSGGITINLVLDAAAQAAPTSFKDGLQQAVAILAANISDKITVNINIDYSGTGGGAAAGPDSGSYESYSWVHSELVNNASAGDTTFNSLPAGTTIQGQSNVAVWNAQLKLWGVIGANDTTTDDASANFSTDINPNLLVGVALHELTHALGRVPYGSAPDVFNLYRFTSPGVHLFQGGATAPAAYFSLDGGNTKIADYGQTSDASDFLNSGVQGPNDPFNEFYNGSTSQQLSKVDLQQLDALGFHLSGSSSGVSVSLVPIDLSNTLTADLNGDGKIDLLQFYQGREMSAVSDGTKFGQWTEWATGATQTDQLADVTGDGKADLVQFYNGRELVAVSSGTKFGAWTDWTTGATAADKLIDVNGDGKSDLVQFYDGREIVALSDGTKFKPWSQWAIGATGSDKLADVSGDGNPDLVQFYNGREVVALSNGTNFSSWTGWITGATASDKLIDVNGDGKADLVQFYDGREIVALSDGTKFKPWSQWAAGATASDKLADVNGDGKPDLIQFYNGREVVALSNGTKFGPWSDWTHDAAASDTFVDLNGDGKVDLLQFKNGDAFAALSTGSSFGTSILWESGPNSAAASSIQPQPALVANAVEPAAGIHGDPGMSHDGIDHHFSNGFFIT